MEIILQTPYQSVQSIQTISIEQYQKKRVQRRRRVAKRQLKRFPLFAVEFMSVEFPNYDYDTFVADVTRKTRKGKSFKKSKSPLIRQGRYPLFQKAMAKYHDTKDEKYLAEAQHWRNRLYLPFEVVFQLNKEQKIWDFPSTTSVYLIQDLVKIKFKTWEELDAILKEKLRYAHVG